MFQAALGASRMTSLTTAWVLCVQGQGCSAVKLFLNNLITKATWVHYALNIELIFRCCSFGKILLFPNLFESHMPSPTVKMVTENVCRSHLYSVVTRSVWLLRALWKTCRGSWRLQGQREKACPARADARQRPTLAGNSAGRGDGSRKGTLWTGRSSTLMVGGWESTAVHRHHAETVTAVFGEG